MKKKILVVDDSPVVLGLLDGLLEKLDYDVTTSSSGFDACARVEMTKYNMIITDLNMPGMNGLEFTKRAKQIPNCKFVPIVMLSAEEDEAKIAEAKNIGISTFLRKPVKENQIKTILQVVLGT